MNIEETIISYIVFILAKFVVC